MQSRFATRIIAAVGAAALLAPMAACGASDGDAANDDTLTVYSYFNKATMDPIVKAFEEANPDIKVQISYGQGDSEYNSTLQTRIAGNQAPDVFNLNGNNVNDLMNNGAVLDLTGEECLDGIDDSYLDTYSKEGKRYGLPISGWLAGIVYNKDLLKEAGYDTVPDTLDGFAKLAKDLNDKGVTPYLENGQEMSGSLIALMGSAEQKSGMDGFAGQASIADTWRTALEAWNTGFIESGALPSEAAGLNGDQIKQAFINGEAAMYRTGGWDVNDIKTSGIDYGFAPFPAYPGSEPYVDGGADPAFAISANTKHEEQAKMFLEFMNTEQGLKLFTTAYGSASISAHYKSESDERIKPLYDDYFSANKYYWVSFSKGSAAMSAEVIAQQQGVQGGQSSPEEAAANIDAKWASVQ